MRFIDVSDRKLTADLFHRVQLSRNSAQYGLLVRVCEFVFWSLMPDQQGAQVRFQNILDDKLRMEALFEEFLRNFYRAELPGWSVVAQRMQWDATADTEQAKSYLPSMLTDITLRSPDRVVVADAKYQRKMLAGGQYQDRLRSGHLYQMVTCCHHLLRVDGALELTTQTSIFGVR